MSKTAYSLADWQGYLTHNEIDMLKAMAENTPTDSQLQRDVVVVNIGAGAGTSTLSFIEARPDIIVFSVDIDGGDQEVYTNEHLRMQETGHDKDGRVIRIWGDSKLAGKRWPMKVDIVFIDGDHSEAGIRGDIEAWINHVQLDGYIAFHDYGSPHWPDVARVVDELFAHKECVEYVAKADNIRVFKVIGEFKGWNIKVSPQ